MVVMSVLRLRVGLHDDKYRKSRLSLTFVEMNSDFRGFVSRRKSPISSVIVSVHLSVCHT